MLILLLEAECKQVLQVTDIEDAVLEIVRDFGLESFLIPAEILRDLAQLISRNLE
jgi:hypothetical protein